MKRIYDVNSKEEKFYKENHEKQTLDYVKYSIKKYSNHNFLKKDIVDMIYELDEIEDESDPDLSLSQIHHSLQTAEYIRKEHPKEKDFQIVGLIHDLGKILSTKPLDNLPQWSVVGDIFPVGCKFSDKIVYSNFFESNPDYSEYDKLGIYTYKCGLDNVYMSFGHDWYLWDVLNYNKSNIDDNYKSIIRYHSFYAYHQENEYKYLSNNNDEENILPLLKKFQKFDLYSKNDQDKLDIENLMTYYGEILNEKRIGILNW